MTNYTYRLTIIGTRVCVSYSAPMDGEPKRVTGYWPTTLSKAYDIDPNPEWLDHPLEESGAYSFRFAHPWPNHLMRDVSILLVDGGKTKSIRTDVEDIPMPSSRGKDMRYHQGAWQRLLKRGWTNC